MAKILILIVEDDKLLVKVYRTNFEVMGYTVDLAHTGQEGWEKIKAGGYAAIVLDLKLPDLSGMQVLSLMKNENAFAKNGPVIVLSNVEDPNTADEVKKLGATDFLLKSKVTPQSIAEDVGKHINLSQNNQQSIN